MHVGISQVGTALAALFGSLLAYFLVAGKDLKRWKDEFADKKFRRLRTVAAFLRNLFSAGLLGATVTIVASRLSDTQFPVKVSVNDFWGSLTIGFFAYFIGNRFLRYTIKKLTPPQEPSPEVLPGTSSPNRPSGTEESNQESAQARKTRKQQELGLSDDDFLDNIRPDQQDENNTALGT